MAQLGWGPEMVSMFTPVMPKAPEVWKETEEATETHCDEVRQIDAVIRRFSDLDEDEIAAFVSNIGYKLVGLGSFGAVFQTPDDGTFVIKMQAIPEPEISLIVMNYLHEEKPPLCPWIREFAECEEVTDPVAGRFPERLVYLIGYVPGMTLREMLNARLFTNDIAKKLVAEINRMHEALAIAPIPKKTHGDMHDDNIIITSDDNVQFIDILYRLGTADWSGISQPELWKMDSDPLFDWHYLVNRMLRKAIRLVPTDGIGSEWLVAFHQEGFYTMLEEISKVPFVMSSSPQFSKALKDFVAWKPAFIQMAQLAERVDFLHSHLTRHITKIYIVFIYLTVKILATSPFPRNITRRTDPDGVAIQMVMNVDLLHDMMRGPFYSMYFNGGKPDEQALNELLPQAFGQEKFEEMQRLKAEFSRPEPEPVVDVISRPPRKRHQVSAVSPIEIWTQPSW